MGSEGECGYGARCHRGSVGVTITAGVSIYAKSITIVGYAMLAKVFIGAVRDARNVV